MEKGECIGEEHHEYIVSRDYVRALVENCIRCGKRLVTRKDDKGRINNEEYLKEHRRDFVQPGGRTGKLYQKYYGKRK